MRDVGYRVFTAIAGRRCIDEVRAQCIGTGVITVCRRGRGGQRLSDFQSELSHNFSLVRGVV